MNYTNIVTEKKENIGIITLNRPQAMNSVNLSMLQELASVLSEFDTDDNIKASYDRKIKSTIIAGVCALVTTEFVSWILGYFQ